MKVAAAPVCAHTFWQPHLKEIVRSCLRPALSMSEAATTVMSTFMTWTPTLASAALVMPACRHGSAGSHQHQPSLQLRPTASTVFTTSILIQGIASSECI